MKILTKCNNKTYVFDLSNGLRDLINEKDLLKEKEVKAYKVSLIFLFISVLLLSLVINI